MSYAVRSWVYCVALGMVACGGTGGGTSGTTYLLSVTLTGTGSGRVTSNPVAIDCGLNCSASLESGTSATLTAVPAAGSDFTGWSGSCSGSSTCTLTIDAAKTVTARFTSNRVAFISYRKLDGSDGANANGTSNIWRVNGDGTGLMALTTGTSIGARVNGNGPAATRFSPDGTRIVFRSSRKLDGTDAPNINETMNIWRVNHDGAGLMPLTNATALDADSYAPQWSPDGSKVVFHSFRKIDGTDAANTNLAANIWQVNADGTGLRIITNTTALGANSASPQWSPDGTKVVFSSARKLDGSDAANLNRTFNIWRANADGTGLMPLTTATAASADSSFPQWSPDGSQIVFQSTRKLDGSDAPNPNGTSNIWRVNADGTGLRIITNTTAMNSYSLAPQWSPDGSKVVFESARKLDGSDSANVNMTLNVWRSNADGTSLTALTRLSAPNAHSLEPRVSPDGTRIIFYSARKLDGTDAPNPNLTLNVWRMNADGTGAMPLTSAVSNGASSFSPSPSP